MNHVCTLTLAWKQKKKERKTKHIINPLTSDENSFVLEFEPGAIEIWTFVIQQGASQRQIGLCNRWTNSNRMISLTQTSPSCRARMCNALPHTLSLSLKTVGCCCCCFFLGDGRVCQSKAPPLLTRRRRDFSS